MSTAYKIGDVIHSLIFTLSKWEKDQGRWRQTGSCTCGEHLEAFSKVNAKQARKLLRMRWDRHVTAKESEEDPG